MIIRDIEVTTTEAGCELRAQAAFDTHWVWGDDPFPLWYRFPTEYESCLSAENGDPFLAFALAPAMLLGEPLEIEAPCSRRLLRAAGDIQAIYRMWNPDLSKVQLRAPARTRLPDDSTHRGSVGLFFSLGADSTYSLLKNAGLEPASEDAVTHLVNVLGFDLDLWETAVHASVVESAQRLAGPMGLKVLPVATNLRELSDRLVKWPATYHGAALASVGLALGSGFSRILIAATATFDALDFWGSHPVLDPLWSTEDVSFVHDGCEATRLEKLRLVASNPSALARLRVCTADEVGEDYNCGRCDKCIRTAIGLHALGALSGCPSLMQEIDPVAARAMRIGSPFQHAYLRDVVSALGSSDLDRSLAVALEECLARSEYGGPAGD